MAAVMRSMAASMGASSAPRHSHSHSIGSSDGGYTSGSNFGEGESLSRTSSRLAPPNPATVFGSPSGGILINATRPAGPGRYNSNDSFGSAGTDLRRNANSSHSLASLAEQERENNELSSTHSRSTSLATTDERGRSLSRDAFSGSGNATSPGGSSRKIRFAPLPEIRQRSYSTGRNVWVDADGVDITEEESARRLMRKDLPRDFEDEDALDTESEDDDASINKGIFGSWRSESGFGGMGNAKDRKENDEGYATKLLRPLSFGLGKKKSKRSPSADGSLARVSSAESDASSRKSVDQLKPTSTGVPMRKARTWELGETAPRETRRANYPPVAQRSRTRAKQPMSVSVPEPKFVEWGGSGGVGSVGTGGRGVGKTGGRDEEEDDGSGMAWIKKRRAQREEEARKKKEEEEAAAATAPSADGTSTEAAPQEGPAPIPIPSSSAEAETPALVLTEPYSPNPGSTSGTSTPTPRTSLLSNTRPQLHISPASTPHVPTMSNDGESSQESSDSPVTPFDELEEPQTITAKSTPIPAANRLSVDSAGRGGNSSAEEDSDDDEDDEDEDDDNKEDDDDDLDEEELRVEEELAQKARATAVGAGAERYHDKDHKSRMLNVEGGGKQSPKIA